MKPSLTIIAPTLLEGQIFKTGKLPLTQAITLDSCTQLYISGMGEKNAAAAAKLLLNNDPQALISWGFAGGLDPGLQPGTLLLPTRILNGCTSSCGVSEPWQKKLLEALGQKQTICTGALTQSPQVVTSPQDKAVLFKQTRAVAVDMESYTIAEIAKEARIPFLAIRAIADPASSSLPLSILNSQNFSGKLNLFAFIGALLKNPQDIPTLLSLARHYRAARDTLRLVQNKL